MDKTQNAVVNTTENVEGKNLNAEMKAQLEADGITAEMAKFAVDDLNNKLINSEGMNLGDIITIVGMADKPDSFTAEVEKNGKKVSVERPYASVITTGDRESVSLGRLIGSPKEKYFAKGRNSEHIDYDENKVLKLPRRIVPAMHAIQALKGKSFQLVEIAENCGKGADRTYYRFVEVEA